MKQSIVLAGMACAVFTALANTATRQHATPASALKPGGPSVTLSHIKSFSIVIPAQATVQEKYSAGLLAEYLGNILSDKLPVVQEPKEVKGKIISVGNTVAASAAGIQGDPREQAYKLAVADGNLFILGGARGPIYGVIALLEEDLGCRWYSSTDRPVVPALADDQLTFVPRSYSPPFEVRELLYECAIGHNDWAAFNRLQPVSYYFEIPAEKGGALANTSYFIHTYDQLVPADKYYTNHPDFFPLRNGKRHTSKQADGQLCYTCPGVADTIARELEAAIAKNPGTRIYSVSANDNVYSDCECPACQKIIKSDDGLSGAQLHLANEVAKRLAVNYPEIKITTLAYVNSQKPTQEIMPGPNTVMFYAPIRQRGNAIAMLQPIGSIKEIAEELAGWHKIASHIYLWDYVDRAGGIAPFPDFDALDEGWPFLTTNGVTGVLLEGQLQGRTSLAELKVWVYTKQMWNPNLAQDALIKEFIEAYYGPAADDMTSYFTVQRQRWQGWHSNRKPGERLMFSDGEKDAMLKFLESALKSCGNKAEYQVKIKREEISWYALMLSGAPTKATAERYGTYLQQVSSRVAELEVKYLGEGVTSEENLRRWSDRLKKVTEGGGLPQYSANSVTVKRPDCPIAEYLQTADGTLGYATRQGGKNSGWGVQWLYDEFIDQLKPDTTYIVRMRVKASFKNAPTKAGQLFGLGYYNFGVGGGSLYNINYDAQDNGQYRWCDLFRLQVVTQGMTGYFYSVPGSDLTGDDAIWYDYLEIVPENEFKDKALAAKLPLVQI